MFKIKFSDQFTNLNWQHYDKRTRYLVQYEQLPDTSKGVFSCRFHESYFSDKQKAKNFCSVLSEFLSEVYFTLDLIELKIRQMEPSFSSDLFPYSTYIEVFNSRVFLLKQSKKCLYAYQHIANIHAYLNALKKHCFNVCECLLSSANVIFIYLQKLEDHFVNTYRSAQQLYENNALQFFPSC